MAILRIRLTFKEGYSDLAKSSSHVEWFSISINISALSLFFILRISLRTKNDKLLDINSSLIE